MSIKRSIATSGAVGLLAISMAVPTLASSHREAPLISRDPSADNTDLYAFVPADNPNTVAIVANYTGFQEPAGGPNFYTFDPAVLYWIKVDNNGDGVEDVTYTFQFQTQVANPDSFLYSGYGPIPTVPANVTQTYTVQRNGVTIGSNLDVPAPHIGPRTTPQYKGIVQDGIHQMDPDRKVFAGQRDDPFFADLGSIFDLGGLRPFNQAHLLPLPTGQGQDALAAFNVNSIVLQVAKKDITKDGKSVMGGATASNAIVGIWAGASRQTLSVTSTAGPSPWVQVSRLGNPLINEVIIPIGQKDEWNASQPANDSAYMNRYKNPELAAIINTIYPSLPDARTTNRDDLVLILGQGVPRLNATNSGSTLYDELRLNMGVAPSAHPNRLGVLAGDLAGFPNGRRLTDDIVDIELRAVADGYGTFLHDHYNLPNKSPNNTIGDGCNSNDRAFLSSFPYVATPWKGYNGGDYRHTPCSTDNQAPASSTAVTAGSAAAASARDHGLAAYVGRSRSFAY